MAEPSLPTLPLLYSYRRCPYAMRARMALLLAGISFDVFEIVLRDKPPAMLALSPKGTVPVLHLPDGRVLEQSWDIMQWALLEEAGDKGGCWSRAMSTENMALLSCNDGEFKQHLDRYKYPDRHPGEAREDSSSAAVQMLLMPLERRLQAQPCLGGDKPCAADLAIFPFVRQFAAVEPAWFASQAWPALQRWLAMWLGSGLFEAGMVKLAPQQIGSFPPYFNGSTGLDAELER